MDPISHTLFTRALTGFDRTRALGPGSRAAAVLGSLAPDIDLVTVFWGWDRYLVVHETWTHTVAAAPVLAVAVALVIRFFVRDARITMLWIAACVGIVIGHLAFDLVSGSDMRPFVPFSDARLGPHWFTMADRLLIAVLVAGLFWKARFRPRVAIWTLAAFVALSGAKAWSKRAAASAFERSRPGAPESWRAIHPSAVNGSLFAWRWFEKDDGVVRVWRVDARTGQVSLEFDRAVPPDDTAVSASRGVPAVQRFLALAHVPFPRVEIVETRRYVLWSDLPDCRPDRCDLSFGAEVDAAGRPVREVIRIGPLEQVREIARATASHGGPGLQTRAR